MTRFFGMSNFDVNREVALRLCVDPEVDEGFEKEIIGDSLYYYDHQRVLHTIFEDYCDNPSLAYSIIFDHKISIYWCGGANDLWFAKTEHTPKVEDENPLRAAMITFLMLTEGGSDDHL